MKKLAAFLLVLSLGMFSIGCGEKPAEPAPAPEGGNATPDGGTTDSGTTDSGTTDSGTDSP